MFNKSVTKLEVKFYKSVTKVLQPPRCYKNVLQKCHKSI